MGDTRPPQVRATHEDPMDLALLTEFMRRSIIGLDGLWFLNTLEHLGAEKALELDIKVFVAQFKITTRVWRKLRGLDGRSVEDKVEVFQALAHLYGHKFECRVEGGRVLMRIRQCAFYENLKRTGRAASHDCRVLCEALWRPWFAEIEPRTGGAGAVELLLPVGGDRCDWAVDQPMDV